VCACGRACVYVFAHDYLVKYVATFELSEGRLEFQIQCSSLGLSVGIWQFAVDLPHP